MLREVEEEEQGGGGLVAGALFAKLRTKVDVPPAG